MAFKMKGPSLLKMVKQMREGTPMKKDGEGTFLTRTIKKAQAAKTRRDERRNKKDKEVETTTTTQPDPSAKQTTTDTKTTTTQAVEKKPVQAKNLPEDVVKIPKKNIKPLPVKTDVKLKGPEDRPDPTFEGTDEFRSLDEIRRDSEKNR